MAQVELILPTKLQPKPLQLQQVKEELLILQLQGRQLQQQLLLPVLHKLHNLLQHRRKHRQHNSLKQPKVLKQLLLQKVLWLEKQILLSKQQK